MTISIVIPCYNAKSFITEAVDSVLAYRGNFTYEIIIVNDGSTDSETIKILQELETSGHTVIHQNNKGPAAARNTGVRIAKGKYILFLDSDNKIKPAYIDIGVNELEQKPDYGVVYGLPEFIGDTSAGHS